MAAHAVSRVLRVEDSRSFQHANIPTPHWLGYLIQRPESHNLHHARGVHRNNYSDLPLWDMAFGTFRNPRMDAAPACGFYDGASGRVAEMLAGRDVTGPEAAVAAPRTGLSRVA